jgi:DNA invertase Pin-like site-specific DNA recombinase
VSHLVSSLEEFKSLGIGFISLTESIDTTTPAGELVFNVIAAIAQFERELIRERIRAGLEHARSRGVKLGRPALDRSMLVEKIAQERQNGKNWGQISRNLGISTRSAKRLILGGGKNSL